MHRNANFTVRTVVFYFPCDFFFFQKKSHDFNTYFNVDYGYIYIHFSFSCISKYFCSAYISLELKKYKVFLYLFFWLISLLNYYRQSIYLKVYYPIVSVKEL